MESRLGNVGGLWGSAYRLAEAPETEWGSIAVSNDQSRLDSGYMRCIEGKERVIFFCSIRKRFQEWSNVEAEAFTIFFA